MLAAGFVVASTVLLAWWAIAGVGIPKRADLAAVPWWAWPSGGLHGLTIFAVFATAGVTGGAVASILLDNYGLVGFEQHPFTWTRATAVVLLVGGTVLMSR